MKHPNDLTPQPLKMTQQDRDKLTCATCGASKIHAQESHDGLLHCGICSSVWRAKESKDGER
jgi:hypothetical protein